MLPNTVTAFAGVAATHANALTPARSPKTLFILFTALLTPRSDLRVKWNLSQFATDPSIRQAAPAAAGSNVRIIKVFQYGICKAPTAGHGPGPLRIYTPVMGPFYLTALLIAPARSVFSQEKPPSLSGARPKWP